MIYDNLAQSWDDYDAADWAAINAQECAQECQDWRTEDPDEVADWVWRHIVAAEANGRTLLYRMPVGGKPRRIRCDIPAEVLRWHTVDGTDYAPWPDEVADETEPLYYTPTTYAGNARQSARLCALRACWVDVDHHAGAVSEDAVGALLDAVRWRCWHDEVPLPAAVSTGRGLHLYWPLQPVGKGELPEWQRVAAALADYVAAAIDAPEWAGWSVDQGVSTDPQRVLRLPGSYNPKAGRACVALSTGSRQRSRLADLAELLLPPEAPTEAPKAVFLPTGANVKLASGNRLERLQAWAEGRKWALLGCRDDYLCICGSLLAAAGCDVLPGLQAINGKLQEPLTAADLHRIAGSVSRKPYKWRNSTIANRLGMTDAEAAAFGAAAGSKLQGVSTSTAWALALESGVDTRRPHRTRDKQRADRKAAKAAVYKKIPQLLAEGMSLREVARTLNLSVQTVSNHQYGL